MDLSIIILNYKQKGLVKQCIKGILAARPNLDYEIIVVDNNSGDGCLEAVRELFRPNEEVTSENLSILDKVKPALPNLLTIQAENNGGFAVGNNLGIRQSNGKYVLILNPDVAIVAGGLEKMVDFMNQHEKIGMVGPKLINPDGSIQESCRRFPSWPVPFFRRTILGRLPQGRRMLDYYLMEDWDHGSNRPVDWLFGACLLVRRVALEKVGLFDERFFMYFEDLDLCRRFWEDNFQVYYFSDVEMVHYHQKLSAEKSGVLGVFSKAGRIHIFSGLKYFAKYFGAKLPNREKI